MKNDVKDYKGLTKQEKQWLKEFDDATEREFYNNKLIDIPDDIKKEIKTEREEFRRDMMNIRRKSYKDADQIVLDQKPHIGKRKSPREHDDKGKFTKKVKDENK